MGDGLSDDFCLDFMLAQWGSHVVPQDRRVYEVIVGALIKWPRYKVLDPIWWGG
jgi:hypothetical protein